MLSIPEIKARIKGMYDGHESHRDICLLEDRIELVSKQVADELSTEFNYQLAASQREDAESEGGCG